MRGRTRWLTVTLMVMLLLSLGAGYAAAGGEEEPECDLAHAGQTRTNPVTGVVEQCIYDEQLGWVWAPIALGPEGQAYTYRTGKTYCSVTLGCVGNMAFVTSQAGGQRRDAGASKVYAMNYPGNPSQWKTVSAGSLRARSVIQSWNGSSWSTCRDSGTLVNTSSGYQWMVGLSMGTVPSCGARYYRTVGTGQMLAGGAWRGSSLTTSSLWLAN